ncbi:hypothetical protein [Ferrimonas balearica]|uniref:hypothetical protein n=1 Tax=Ferrimonas balearica TaxID=44012 RepID=UPI001C968BD6|nr:hypothetical protein [Ferrimonas balearica]MBY5979223.1 hypothetical protein [Ferrimonas balearica]
MKAKVYALGVWMVVATSTAWGTVNPAAHNHASEAQCQLVPPFTLAEELNVLNARDYSSSAGKISLNSRKPGESLEPDCWLQRECYPGAGTIDDPYILDISAITTLQGISQVGARNIEHWALTGVARLNDTLANSGINNIRAEFRQLMVVPDNLYQFGHKVEMVTDRVDFANCQPCRAWVRQAGADLMWVFHPYPQETGLAGVTGIGSQVAMINLLPDNVSGPEYTIVHEVGHQLGGGHQIETADAFGAFDYSYASMCEQPDGSLINSAVASGAGDARLWQFSSPSMPCGVEGVTDNARTVRELGGYRASYSLRPPVVGTVALSLDHTEVDEGDAITVTLTRSGPLDNPASVGLWLDGEQDEPVLVDQHEVSEWHFIPAYLEQDYHFIEFEPGQKTHSITVQTRADGKWRETPEILFLSLEYPGAIALEPSAYKSMVWVNNTDPIQPGKLRFATSEMRIREGSPLLFDVIREDGSDGELYISVETDRESLPIGGAEYLDERFEFQHGETTATFQLNTLHQSNHYQDQTLTLTLSQSGLGQGDVEQGRATVIIENVDVEPPPPPPQKSKSGGSMSFGLALLILIIMRLKRQMEFEL